MLPLVVLSSFQGAQTAAPAPAPAAQSVTVPFTYQDRLVFLEARVKDSPRLFLLDTGANTTAIDAQTATELALAHGEPHEIEGATGKLTVDSARVPEIAVGALAAHDLAVTVQDLSGSLHPEKRHLDGILGSDFLAGFVLQLDFTNARLTLSQGALAADEAALPFELDEGIPHFPAQLDDTPVQLRLDTGASLFAARDVFVNVPTSLWEELQRADPTLKIAGKLAGGGPGGQAELPVGRLSALLVGPTSLARPYVIVQPRVGYFARPDALGFVGNNFLEKFEQVTLDYPGRHLWLGPRDEGG